MVKENIHQRTGYGMTDVSAGKKGILPPYREAITPLNSNTPIIFHSMTPILLSGISIILPAGFVNDCQGIPLNRAYWPRAFSGKTGPGCVFFDGAFLRMIS